MICPRCRARVGRADESCSHCRFHLGTCEKLFPFAAPPLELLIDPTRLLPDGIEKDLTKARQKLRKRFPQVEISFCFVRLQESVATPEFAFWLHNAAPNADEARAWQILVVGDLASGRLALTTGYALEPFIKPELWEAALQELAACIADKEWREGLNGFLADVRSLLFSAWHQADQRRSKNERKIEAVRLQNQDPEQPHDPNREGKPRPNDNNETEATAARDKSPARIEEPVRS